MKKILLSLGLGLVLAAASAVVPEGLTNPSTVYASELTETPTTEESETPVIAQKQTITVKVSSKSYNTTTLEKAKKTFKIGASAKTALSYEVTSGSKYVSVDESGLVTVKKGTPKGTYKIKITAKATDEYKKATKTIKITVVKPQLSDLNISWDLKNNKAVTFKGAIEQCDKNGKNATTTTLVKYGTVTIKNYKVTNASKKGYKKLTFTVVYNLSEELSKTAVDKMCYYDEYYGNPNGDLYWTVCDYVTGENLENADNTQDVTVTGGDWKCSGSNTYYGTSSSRSYSTYKKMTKKVTVIYPDTYKNMCILAGGYSDVGKAWDTSLSFKKNTKLYSKKDKQVCHGLRVK